MIMKYKGNALLAFIFFLSLAGLADAQEIGIGEKVPNIISDAYNGGIWEPFELYEYFNPNWEKGKEGDWVVLDFADTDCPNCIRAAAKVTKWSKAFSSTNKKWTGPNVRFFAIATSLNIRGHDSSRSEIEAFRDKTRGESCAGSDCYSRSGKAHNFPYVDDLAGINFRTFKLRSTPSYMLIQPDGRLAWYSRGSNSKGDLAEAIELLTRS